MMQAALPAAPRWRWPLAAATVLAFHAVALLLLRDLQPAPFVPDIPQQAILLDLAPAAPEPAPTEPAPPPPPPSPAETIPAVAAPPDPAPTVSPPEIVAPVPPPPPVLPDKPDVTLPPPPPPPPKPRVVAPRRPTPVAKPHLAPAQPVPTAPSVAEQPPAAPAPQSAAAPARAAPGPEAATWAGRLAAHLMRFRHYPAEAERRGFTGVVTMRFSVDGSGHIVSQSMIHGSGHDTLDEEAVAWLARAQPLPIPPPDHAAPALIVVPLAFVLH